MNCLKFKNPIRLFQIVECFRFLRLLNLNNHKILKTVWELIILGRYLLISDKSYLGTYLFIPSNIVKIWTSIVHKKGMLASANFFFNSRKNIRWILYYIFKPYSLDIYYNFKCEGGTNNTYFKLQSTLNDYKKKCGYTLYYITYLIHIFHFMNLL